MSAPNQTPEPAPDSESSDRPTTALAAAAIFLILVVVAGLAVAFTRNSDDDTTTAPTTTTSTAPPAAAATGFATPQVDTFGRRVDVPNNSAGQPLGQTVAQRKPTDPDWKTAAPAGTRDKGGWQRVTGAVVPFSTSDGPTRIDNGVPVGYAHTPQGAALAAAYVMWETGARPGDRALRERMVVMTAAQLAEFDRLKAAGKVPDQQPESVTRYMVAADAFRVEQFSDDLCVVSLATRSEPDKNNADRWISSQIAMVWDGSNWRMQLAADSRLPQQTVFSLAGWTAW
ncbi:hypothetical protein [Nocardia salmonicida]|uniref:hypothetical protein n=1 Tax=Nocardia salmonicida TaxID=53431 RepID=UPI0037A27842